MIPSERQARLLRELELRGSFSSAEFARRIGVSGMTVRRDLAELERHGLLERVHGGAIPPIRESGEHPLRAPAARAVRPVTIGMIVPSAQYYFPGVIAGAKAAAAELGARLVLATSGYSAQVERQQIQRMIATEIDGLLVTPTSTFEDDERTYDLVAGVSVPAVLVERRIGGIATGLPVPSVSTDHGFGAELAIRHLSELGHRNIALAWRESPTASAVRTGFHRAVAALAPEGMRFDTEIPGEHADVAATRDVLSSVLDRCRDAAITALVVLPDDAAVAVIELAADRALAIPEDLSIVAYDDELASLASVPLTAVAPPKSAVGYRALRTCADRIASSNDESPAESVARISLLPSLTVRESTSQS